MIELPAGVVPHHAVPALVDPGGIQRSPINSAGLRIDRSGAHYRVALTFPPLDGDTARIVVSRLIRAKSEGLRVAYPLVMAQGAAGSPVVDLAGQTGKTLNLRGMTPGYVVGEGFWLSIVRTSDGQHFLHNVASGGTVAANGKVTLTLSEALRAPFADASQVRFATPMIEGLVEGEVREWDQSVDQLVSIEITIEEAR